MLNRLSEIRSSGLASTQVILRHLILKGGGEARRIRALTLGGKPPQATDLMKNLRLVPHSHSKCLLATGISCKRKATAK
jgi:hypothetical protein